MDDLEEFGKEFVTEVLDYSLEEHQIITQGGYNSEEAKDLHKKYVSLNEDQRTIVDDFVSDLILRSIQRALYFFETSENWAIVPRKEIESSNVNDLAQISDGLSGELFSESGWIHNYSKLKSMLKNY